MSGYSTKLGAARAQAQAQAMQPREVGLSSSLGETTPSVPRQLHELHDASQHLSSVLEALEGRLNLVLRSPAVTADAKGPEEAPECAMSSIILSVTYRIRGQIEQLHRMMDRLAI
jgi:hypothetical protein